MTRKLLSALVLLCSLQASAQEDIKDILKKADKRLNEINTISYTIKRLDKHHAADDTNVYKAQVVMKRADGDYLKAYHTVDMRYVWEGKESGAVSRYDGKYIFAEINSEYPYAFLKNVTTEGYTTTTANKALLNEFFEKRYLRKYKSNILAKVLIDDMQLSDTVFAGEPCYVFSVYAEKGSDFRENRVKHYIRKSDYLPIGYEYSSSLNYMVGYESYMLTDIKINEPLKPEFFTVNVEKAGARVKAFNEANKEKKYIKPDKDTLVVGDMAPDFKAELMNGDNVSMQGLRGKVVVLDFWYRACYPCLKAIPHINELYQTYKDKDVVVLGINQRDSKEQVVRYFTNNNIGYASTYNSEQIDNKFGIVAHPTVIVIDRDGKVQYRAESLTGKDVRDINKIIKTLLEQ